MTLNDLENFILEYLESKLPGVPKHTLIEVTETIMCKFIICKSDALEEYARFIRDDLKYQRKSARPIFPE